MKWLGMLILVRCEALEVMLDYEFIDKFPSVLVVHRNVPDTRDQSRKCRSPCQAYQEIPRRDLVAQQVIKPYDPEWQNYSDEALCKKCDPYEDVEK